MVFFYIPSLYTLGTQPCDLNVLSLVNKNIGVLFLPQNATLIDLDDDISILVYASQYDDGLFNISNNHGRIHHPPSSNVKTLRNVLRFSEPHTQSI